jgi:Kef-type K+ transport system membrane component KefB
MPAVQLTNLLIVAAAGLLAPIALGFLPRVRLPAIVLEIVLGIVIGPSGLGWAEADVSVSILALVGLAFLLFLSGLALDVQRLRGRVLRLSSFGFAVSFAIALVLGFGLRAGGLAKSSLFVAIVLVATSPGAIVPVLKDSGEIENSFGQLVVAAASIANFGSIILLSAFFSGSMEGGLFLLGGFGLVVLLVGLAIAGVEHSMSVTRLLQRLQDTTAEIRVRAAFVLVIGLTAIAEEVGLATILGASAAGALLSLVDRDEGMTHPQFRLKLEAVGFGVFIPIFFVTTGVQFDLGALFANAATVARVPLFLLAIYLARGLPALAYVGLLGRRRSVIAGVLQSTTLPFVVAATQIGFDMRVLSRASAAGLIAAALLSVVISPTLASVLLHRISGDDREPSHAPQPSIGIDVSAH